MLNPKINNQYNIYLFDYIIIFLVQFLWTFESISISLNIPEILVSKIIWNNLLKKKDWSQNQVANSNRVKNQKEKKG